MFRTITLIMKVSVNKRKEFLSASMVDKDR